MLFLLDLAWRDLKASGRSLWVFCACLILGVSLVTASAGLYRLIHQGLLADTRILMGGDVEVESPEPLPDKILEWMETRGDVSLLTEVDTMLGTETGEFLRIELQSTDTRYPLYGELTLDPPLNLDNLTAFRDGFWGVAIDPVLATRLDLSIGDMVYIGSLQMQVRALVLNQPDRNLSASWRGTPVLLKKEAMETAGLIQKGSRVEYEYRVRTEIPAEQWRVQFNQRFNGLPLEVRTFEDRNQRLAERLGQIVSGLMIIGFCTLFVGGLGVFNSIQAYLHGKLKTIAIFRSLGLRNRRLATVYLLQISLLSGAASLVGALLGTGMALASAGLLATELPVQAGLGSLLLPVVIAVLFGILNAYAFTLPALGSALAVQTGVLFSGQRREAGATPKRWWLASLGCAALIITLVCLVLPDVMFAFGFICVIGFLLLMLDATVKVIRRTALALDTHPILTGRFALRLAIANLHRPGAPLRTTLLSLGSALTLLVVCTLVVASLLRAVNSTIPEESPALVLYDVLPHQREQIVSILEQMPSATRVDLAPLVRARIQSINGQSLSSIIDQQQEKHLQHEWQKALQEEYKLSYSANNIDDVKLVEGQWWSEPISGRARMALEDREARQLGLKRGDWLTFDIEGKSVEAEVAAIFSQKGLQTRFWFEGILSDHALDEVSKRFVGAAYMSDDDALKAQNAIAKFASNVISVRTESILLTAREMMTKASSALLVVALVSLVASLLVLSSVIAVGQTRLVYEASILNSLGARMQVIKRSLLMEYLLLALLATLFAVLLGSAIGMALLEWRLKLPSGDLIWLGALSALTISLLSLGLGAAYLLRRLTSRPAILLRET